MKRTTASGNVLNKFTDGDPVGGVPATVVEQTWLNSVQEEICYVIEQLGFTLNGAITTQLLAAMQKLINQGGAIASIAMAPANNQIAAADVTGFPVFLSTAIFGIEIFFRCTRVTGSGSYYEIGRAYLNWNGTSWVASKVSVGDDAINFSAVGTGNANEFKLQYATDNLAGTGYVGTLKITDIKYIF